MAKGRPRGRSKLPDDRLYLLLLDMKDLWNRVASVEARLQEIELYQTKILDLLGRKRKIRKKQALFPTEISPG